MLNISKNRIHDKIRSEDFSALNYVEKKKSGRVFLRLTLVFFALFFIIMFLPWTQNIRGTGKVTTLYPNERPNTIHSVIAGRIEKWYIKEGDLVHKGDTIMFISEIKDEYFDPQLLTRTEQQLKSKEMSVESYMEKVKSLDNQIDALSRTSVLKLEQAKNKLKQALLLIKSDSMDYQAAKINYDISEEQFKRYEELYKDGLKSQTDLENRKLKMQESQAKLITVENKLLKSRNELINAKIELSSIQAQYSDEISKAESNKFTALSNMYDAEAVVTKMQNQYINYSVRTGMYYITAPQDGYVTKAIQSGIGETIKEGAELVSIMPLKYTLAVEMYIQPIDLPLLHEGHHVRIQFDGWPAIVFSGWPNTSYGTYGGKIVAIDNFISENGKFRVLVAPDSTDVAWPKALRVGSGASSMILLNDVPIWYELWRKINGFPPNYYTKKAINDNKSDDENKK